MERQGQIKSIIGEIFETGSVHKETALFKSRMQRRVK